jgi:ATP-binding cassette subfamily G (WHITE) protein 2
MLDAVLRAPPEEVSRMVASFRSSEVQGANALLAERVRLQLSFRQQQAPPPPARKYVAGFWLQLRVLCGRLLRNAYRHPFLFWLHFVATLAVALCIGAVFRHAGVDTGGIQDRLGALFFMLLYLSFISLGSLPVWHEERLLFARERAAGAYGANAYFTAVVLFDILPLRVLPPLFFIASYALIGLRAGCLLCVARFTLVLMLASVTASSLCMAIGSFAPSNAVANVMGSIALLTAALFGGFLVQRDALPAGWRWLAMLSPINHAFEALAVNEFHGTDGFAFTSRVAPDARVSVNGDQVLATFGFQTSWSAFASDVRALLALAAAFLTLAYSGIRSQKLG